MKYEFQNSSLDSTLLMLRNEDLVAGTYSVNSDAPALLTIAWNTGPDQKVTIDGVTYDFPNQVVLPLMMNDSYHFSNPKDIVAWQFNKDFYCIVDHDKEVSCVGFIFHGLREHLFIKLDEKHQRKLESLTQVFKDEFEEHNTTQEEMLRMLLKRLIILVTRWGKMQFMPDEIDDQEEDLIRKFNLLVAENYKTLHQVQDYANMLNKAPKTLSNLFSKYNKKSPLHIIHDRIILEAKRQLYYTDRTSKEIAFDLGFEDPATFSRFFKKYTKESPTNFKKKLVQSLSKPI